MSEYKGKKEFEEAGAIVEALELELEKKLSYRARLNAQIDKIAQRHRTALEHYLTLKGQK